MTVTYRSPRLVWRHTQGAPPARERSARGIIDAEDLHPLESVGHLVEDLLGSGQDRVVGGVPGDPLGGCYPADRHALQGKGTQPPLHRRAGQPGPGLSQAARVLSPHSTAVGAGEAPHAHHQLRGPPPHRHVGQASGHRPTGYSLGAAGSAKRGPQTRSACGTPQWLSSRSGADPPRSVPGRPAPGRSSDQGRRR